MRTAFANVCILVLASAAPLACKERSATAPIPRAATANDAPVPADASVTVTDGGTGDASLAAADASSGDTIAWNDYFSLKQRPDDVLNAYQATFEKMSSAPLTSFDDAVVLCRVGLVEPAPLPSSAWDRANGRDLLLETKVDDEDAARAEGPLGHPAFHVRVDDAFRRAASGARVSWLVRDRDQQHAYPYVTGIEIGTFLVPRDVKVPLHVTPPKLDITCRGMASVEASHALLAEADAALAEAEREATSPDPRSGGLVRPDLTHAADRLRIGEVIARSMRRTEEWSKREERLRAVVRRYVASARDAYDKLAPAPPGNWARIGPTASARIGKWVCPAVPKNVDPGSLNDDQRDGCGLVLELRSVAKLRFDPNPWGPAYACRITGPIAIESIDGPEKVNGVCTVGIRRGTQWFKSSVELAPAEPTVFVLAAASIGGPIRISIGGASALLDTPPRP